MCTYVCALMQVSCSEPYEWKDPTISEWEFSQQAKEAAEGKRFKVGGLVVWWLGGVRVMPHAHGVATPSACLLDILHCLLSLTIVLHTHTHTHTSLTHAPSVCPSFPCCHHRHHHHYHLIITLTLTLTIIRLLRMTLASSTTSCAAWPHTAAASQSYPQTTPQTRSWHSTPTASSSATDL